MLNFQAPRDSLMRSHVAPRRNKHRSRELFSLDSLWHSRCYLAFHRQRCRRSSKGAHRSSDGAPLFLVDMEVLMARRHKKTITGKILENILFLAQGFCDQAGADITD